jgi:hypothetical protein
MFDFSTTLHLQEREKVIQQRIERYFEENGYQAKLDANNDVYYERGSVWRNYIALNPRNWHVFAAASVQAVDEQTVSVDVELHVDTQGQMLVVERERQYWETEFDVLTAYIETGKSKQEDILGTLSRRNYRQNVILNAWVMLAMCAALFILLGLLVSSRCFC